MFIWDRHNVALELVALFTGAGAIISAIAGVLLAAQRARSKERKAANAEIHEVEGMLDEVRQENIECKRNLFRLRTKLAEHGLNDDADTN